MTTLTGNDLFEYLDHLDGEFSNLQRTVEKVETDSLSYVAHSSMREILKCERIFLERYHSTNGRDATLSFYGNGLPSLDSLRPDLEAICNLGAEEIEFKKMAESYSKECLREYKVGIYSRSSSQEWKERMERNKGELKSKIELYISPELENEMMNLRVRENYHINGIDKASKEIPVLSREIDSRYQVAFNKLFNHSVERFYIANTDLIVPRRKSLTLGEIYPLAPYLNDISKIIRGEIPPIKSYGLKDYESLSDREKAQLLSLYFIKNFLEYLPNNKKLFFDSFFGCQEEVRISLENNTIKIPFFKNKFMKDYWPLYGLHPRKDLGWKIFLSPYKEQVYEAIEEVEIQTEIKLKKNCCYNFE